MIISRRCKGLIDLTELYQLHTCSTLKINGFLGSMVVDQSREKHLVVYNRVSVLFNKINTMQHWHSNLGNAYLSFEKYLLCHSNVGIYKRVYFNCSAILCTQAHL